MTLRSGECETFKAGVHLGLFGLAIACVGYNLMAWGERKDRHLLQNAIIYGGLATYEYQQIVSHLKECK